MLFKNTFIVETEQHGIIVKCLPDDMVRLFYAGESTAIAVYGIGSQAVQSFVTRSLSAPSKVLAYVPVNNSRQAELVAMDDAWPEGIRATAAALALGRILPGSHDDSGSGGLGVRPSAPNPTRPPNGGAVAQSALTGEVA